MGRDADILPAFARVRQTGLQQSNSRWLNQFAAFTSGPYAHGGVRYVHIIISGAKMDLLFHTNRRAFYLRW